MSDNAGGGFDFRHDYKSGLALKHCSPCRAFPLSLRSFRQEHIIVSGEVVMCQLKGLCSQHFQAGSDTSMSLILVTDTSM